MEELAKEYADRATFLFVYIREAHPGEVFPHHTSLEQKVRHAQAFRERGLERPILLDSLDGEVNRMYGAVSNMSWIIDHTGHVSFRATWTAADDIRAALDETLLIRELRRQGQGASAYYRETMGLKPTPQRPEEWLGGQKAIDDFQKFVHKAPVPTSKSKGG
ncbi:MAG: Iodothyronine deiodinase [Chloroflexi bacterium]|jgi:hypothetical protein|nr:MAG: Iodothyronine deiodinase [Chloroflexota bacterium]